MNSENCQKSQSGEDNSSQGVVMTSFQHRLQRHVITSVACAFIVQGFGWIVASWLDTKVKILPTDPLIMIGTMFIASGTIIIGFSKICERLPLLLPCCQATKIGASVTTTTSSGIAEKDDGDESTVGENNEDGENTTEEVKTDTKDASDTDSFTALDKPLLDKKCE